MTGDIFIRNHIVFKLSSYINAGKANYALLYTKLFQSRIKRDYQGSFYAGIIMNATGQEQKAEAYYSGALRLFPYFEGALFNLGNLYFRQGKYDKAAEKYGRVLDINPLNSQAINNMGKALIERKEYQQAVILLEKAGPSRDDAYIKYNLALAYYMSDNGTKALMILQELLELSPDFTLAEELLRKIKAGRGGV
ncbi:MAG: tetratricopeptide repeat protein [Candidatus Goldbacteria bacterium]|nr:tetratricopeptide repeat protein [Candidatus Goldiibacteriota bacterium]